MDIPREKSLFVYFNGHGWGYTYTFSVYEAFQIDVPVKEYVVVEADPGNILVTIRRPVGAIRAPVLIRDKRFMLVAGQEVYVSDNTYFEPGPMNDLEHLERWKPPFAYVKLCDHNTRVCEDSPTKPPPKAAYPPEPKRRPPAPLS